MMPTMIRPRLALVLCASMLGACATNGSDGDGSVSDADPRSGVWSYQDGGITQTDCDSTDALYTDPDTEFLLTNNGDGSFTIAQGEHGDFDCSIDGDDFECPQRLYDELSVDGYDAVVSWQVSVAAPSTETTRWRASRSPTWPAPAAIARSPRWP